MLLTEERAVTPQVSGAASAHQRRSETAELWIEKWREGGKNMDLKYQERVGWVFEASVLGSEL